MIHHVYANRTNIGDWLSAIGIQSLLRSVLPGATFAEHFCDEPFVPETLSALAALGPDDHVIIGGGGLFMDYFEPFWRGFAALDRRFDYTIWGAGYCDLKAEPSRPDQKLMQSIARGASLCVVRDALSLGLLDLPGLPAPVPCPSIAVIERAPAGEGILHVDNYTTVGAPAFDVMDRDCSAEAARREIGYRRTNNRIAGDDASRERCLALYARSGLVVSSALHGCVIAVAMGKPVIAVSGDWKIDAFMQTAGLDQWVVDAADAERVPDLLGRLHEQPMCVAFVDSARAANLDVARRVLARDQRPTAAGRRE